MQEARFKILSFPDQDPILNRLKSVEELVHNLRELNDADLNLDFMLISIQSSLDSYGRFLGSFSSEDSITSSSEGEK